MGFLEGVFDGDLDGRDVLGDCDGDLDGRDVVGVTEGCEVVGVLEGRDVVGDVDGVREGAREGVLDGLDVGVIEGVFDGFGVAGGHRTRTELDGPWNSSTMHHGPWLLIIGRATLHNGGLLSDEAPYRIGGSTLQST